MSANELPKRYILLGPDHPNREDEVQAWNEKWGWVDHSLATTYSNEIFCTPLPPGTQAIMSDDGVQFPVDPSGRVGSPIV